MRTFASATGDATSASATCILAETTAPAIERDGIMPAWKALAAPLRSTSTEVAYSI